MALVHANEVNCTVDGLSNQVGENTLHKALEFVHGHLAGGELAMLGGAQAGDMVVNRHVVGPVGKDHQRLLVRLIKNHPRMQYNNR